MNPNLLNVLKRAQELHRLSHPDAVEATQPQGLEFDDKSSRDWLDLSGFLLETGRLDEACEACSQALALEPGQLDIRLILADVLELNKKLDLAAEELTKVIRQDPMHLNAHNKLGNILYQKADWPGLYQELERYLDVTPSDETEFEKSCLNLLFGRMPLGWEQYESRWKTPGAGGEYPKLNPVFPQPEWRGESFIGKTLLLRWEQAFGDNIMFVRYAPMVKARGGRVLLETLGPLVDLLATCDGVDEVFMEGEPLPPFDLQLPLLSLPRIFKTDLDSIPAEVPYLAIPEKVPHREGIDRILGATEGLLRVGLVWAGRPRPAKYPDRSIPPDLLKPLESLQGIVWHSFQMEQEGELPFPRIIRMAPVLRGGFADTAYALSRMDLVITVDSAVAHLAGALGLPTFLLAHGTPDWRWLMGRDDSPWYPTMRIYRQQAHGDWGGVIKRVMDDLVGG
jgi:hypothetical protein